MVEHAQAEHEGFEFVAESSNVAHRSRLGDGFPEITERRKLSRSLPIFASTRPSLRCSALGDAAKVIARKMREQDSIYILAPACFGVVLPGVDLEAAERVCARVSEGLADAAGAKAYVDAQWNEATVKQRYDWIFQYDATRVAI